MKSEEKLLIKALKESGLSVADVLALLAKQDQDQAKGE
jgi:DNA-binding transcriptional MerR regulator